MQIPDQRYLTNTASTFRGTYSASALSYLGWTISAGNSRKLTEYKWSYEVTSFSALDKLVKLCIWF